MLETNQPIGTPETPEEAPEAGVQQRPALYHNRELSWLKFNERVLRQSADPSIPLLERMKFISIFANNLDEFFMIRVGTLTDAVRMHPEAADNKSGMPVASQLEAIFTQTRLMISQKDMLCKQLESDLERAGITHLHMDRLSVEQTAYLSGYFATEIQPILSPQIIDKHHPFPFLKNKETYICLQLKTKGEFVKLAMIPVSTGFDRMIYLPFENGHSYVLFEELVYCYCQQIFESYEVVDKTIFRITRNADINADEALFDHDIDYRSAMEEMVKNRRKLMPVRIEFYCGVGSAIRDSLCAKLELEPERVFVSDTPLDMSYGFAMAGRFERKGMKELFYPPLIPQVSAMVNPRQSMMEQIEKGDILLCYPFESMKAFIDLLEEAAVDETVISIKMTLYRVARESQIVAALIKAAENGKQVHVVVELRARFDEENNIIWSKRLEEAGVNVIYGLGEYKVHSKLLVITRKRGDRISFITQVGTGNYNEGTARQYTDLCLMTADWEFGEEGTRIFNGILTDNPTDMTDCLLAAPLTMKPRILEYIGREISYAKRGEKAEITVKINSLTDKEIIDRLIEASMAGVHIRMIIRGICCLRVGVPGYTDNIEVISIVGRFLEHSRVYVFGPAERCDMYISSADFMTRNMERRVEVACAIHDPTIRARLLGMLQVQFYDNVKAQRLLEDGTYVPVKNNRPPTDSQIDFYKQAYIRAELAAKKKEQVQVQAEAKEPPSVQPQDQAVPEPAAEEPDSRIPAPPLAPQPLPGTKEPDASAAEKKGVWGKLRRLFGGK